MNSTVSRHLTIVSEIGFANGSANPFATGTATATQQSMGPGRPRISLRYRAFSCSSSRTGGMLRGAMLDLRKRRLDFGIGQNFGVGSGRRVKKW